MKKVIALFLSVAMVLGLVGCGSTTTTQTTGAESEASSQSDKTTNQVWEDQTGKGEACGDENGEYTVGVIIHTTTDFLCSKYKAYTDYLGKAYGVKFNYYIIENFADETYLSAIENLCAQGVNAIITTNFSGTAVLQGLKTCEDNGVYLGVGWSQIDERIRDRVFSSDYFVGSSYEADYDAGYKIITSLIDEGCTNIAAIGYEPGITCHDRRWEGMMKAFEDHPEVKKAGEYRGLEFTKAVEDFLAADETIDGIAITLLGIEYCSEPIKSAGREGQVKIAFCDLSENCQESLDSGETVCAIGGQYTDVVFPFVLIYNALQGNPMEKVEVPVNFITCKSGTEFSNYMKYLHNDGVYAWTTDEIDQLIVSKNSAATSDDLLKMGADYSVEDTIARHGK
jgi:ribose transport system substrate-binding protein